MRPEDGFAALRARAAGDPHVLGVVLSGSQAREGMATSLSDHDVLLVVDDAAETSAGEVRRDARLDLVVMPLREFRRHALPGSGTEWNRAAFTRDLADATLRLIDAGASGIYHVVNSGHTTWHGFTAAILEEFDLKADLSRTTSAEWQKSRPNSAIRPAYSVLDRSKYTQTTGHTMRHWREALHDYRLAISA